MAKFDDFKTELIELLEKHQLVLTTSGYDFIEVWKNCDGGDVIFGSADSLIDQTEKQ
tara:strand:- start:1253 stop:1423 length:171 start_codon:yes stop_codon:yes gene_type:complete